MGREVRLFTIVYGAPFVARFLTLGIRSLLGQPGNVARLLREGWRVGWDLHTDLETDLTAPRDAIARLSPSIDLTITRHAAPDVTHKALVAQVGRALDRGAPVFFAAPDTFFGDESLGNVAALWADLPGCLMAPHFRVVEDAFLPLVRAKGRFANDELVSLALAALHPSWAVPSPSPFYRAVLRQVSAKLFEARTLGPTPYLLDFRPDDLAFLADHPMKYMAIDHGFPDELARQGRYQLIGGSDLFFAVEACALHHNIPDLAFESRREGYSFNEVQKDILRSVRFACRSRYRIDAPTVEYGEDGSFTIDAATYRAQFRAGSREVSARFKGGRLSFEE